MLTVLLAISFVIFVIIMIAAIAGSTVAQLCLGGYLIIACAFCVVMLLKRG